MKVLNLRSLIQDIVLFLGITALLTIIVNTTTPPESMTTASMTSSASEKYLATP
ncbi:hypothetical protein [Bdellovibrio sp. ZAP7]|uniref:hypothetical protein n=1 Tax=Bdellovibrio sp. ZAP7 TaxID=2231053 RepID=UPI00143D8C23|nr:hypothetical protein [Bdellovibrio sp. ZAP7]